MDDPEIILAIESAISGGSLALMRRSEIICEWIGEGGVSRAEDLLLNIDLILKRGGVKKDNLTQIAVSVGPGSFTGIRIGLATAMGLATALSLKLSKFSILHAMANQAPDGESVLTAVPVGRGVMCTQRFQQNTDKFVPLDMPTAISSEDFDRHGLSRDNFVITPEDIENGLASCLALAAGDARIEKTEEPLFIAKPANI